MIESSAYILECAASIRRGALVIIDRNVGRRSQRIAVATFPSGDLLFKFKQDVFDLFKDGTLMLGKRVGNKVKLVPAESIKYDDVKIVRHILNQVQVAEFDITFVKSSYEYNNPEARRNDSIAIDPDDDATAEQLMALLK